MVCEQRLTKLSYAFMISNVSRRLPFNIDRVDCLASDGVWTEIDKVVMHL